MRTPRRPQSALLSPLNDMLGTEANVRLLRVLSLTRTPIAAGELAARADLNRTSVYPALGVLEQAGIVAFVGTGAQRQVRLRTTHPLASPLRALFRAEARRVEDLLTSLREAARTLEPAPTSVWIEGPVLAHEDRPGDALVCCVLADPAALPGLVDELSERVVSIERAADVTIEVRGTTRSELLARSDEDAASLRDAILLAGVPPDGLRPDVGRARARVIRLHDEHDVRARRLALAIAIKLKRDPELVRVAREQLEKRSRAASPRERRELREWTRILTTMSPGRLQRFLTEPGERATRLRQTLPLLGVLSPAERRAVLASTSDAEVREVIAGKRRRSQAT
jgi:DNA-binding transcriptional ArsR family regulator